MFSDSHNFIINGGQFTGFEQGMDAIQFLAQNIASDAKHDSGQRFPPPLCHPGTRERVIEQLVRWSNDMDDQSNILWLYGPAGVGKSAIAQSVCERLERMKTLGASFFFSRTEATRNNVQRLFTTIAYQLAVFLPITGLRKAIEMHITRDPDVISQSMEAQWRKLVAPLKTAVGTKDALPPTVIVIDGLDECLDEDAQVQMLKMIASASSYGLPLRIIISKVIKHTLKVELIHSDEVDREIQLYLKDELKKVRFDDRYAEIMQYNPSWPSESDIKRLVVKASGQYIYAATVLKHVREPSTDPVQQLENVLLLPDTHATAFAELDQLYLQILRKSKSAQRDRILSIIGLMIVILREERPFQLPTLSIIEQLLNLKPGHLRLALEGLHSLLYIPQFSSLGTWDRPEPRLHHASLEDFLRDKSRSHEYFINERKVYAEIIGYSKTILTSMPPACHAHDTLALLSNDNKLYEPIKTCNFVGWYYSLSKWLSFRCNPQVSEVILESPDLKFWIYENKFLLRETLGAHAQSFKHSKTDPATSQHPLMLQPTKQLHENSHLEFFILTTGLIFQESMKNGVSGTFPKQPFSDLLDLLICNPYMHISLRNSLILMLSEYTLSKIIPTSYESLVPAEWIKSYSVTNAELDTPIHVKIIRERISGNQTPNEAILCRHLNHPNIVPFFGATVFENKFRMITPPLKNMQSTKFLEQLGPHVTDRHWLFLFDIASGIAYLHENGIIHQQIYPGNILVSNSQRAYLTGLEHSVFFVHGKAEVGGLSTMPGFPHEMIHYFAPEILTGELITSKTDIYSFSTICYEAASTDSREELVITQAASEKQHPSKPPSSHECWHKNGLTEFIWEFMCKCWNNNSQDRPELQDIFHHLKLRTFTDNRPKDCWKVSSHFNNLNYVASFVMPSALDSAHMDSGYTPNLGPKPNLPHPEPPHASTHNSSEQPPAHPNLSFPLMSSGVGIPWSLASSSGNQLYMHPWLDATRRSDLYFDLSQNMFSPRSINSSDLSSPPELLQNATYPPVSELHVSCKLIPQWPMVICIDTEYDIHPLPPITVGDVLGSIYISLHQRITHLDWAKLTAEKERSVAKAYYKRCGGDAIEKASGVKRVDFLLRNVFFKGLTKTSKDGVTKIELIVGKSNK
ncbi:hypothetical protein BDQ17DRAFT_1370567 [Cyathus striatus]|nr:hypothetical protein BDQ17DRAFT_1370567 [Cyathus striatus]